MDWLGSRLCLTAAVGKDGAILSESGWRNVGAWSERIAFGMRETGGCTINCLWRSYYHQNSG